MEWQRDTHEIVSFTVSPVPWSQKEDMIFSNEDENGCTTDVYVADIDSNHRVIKRMESDGTSGGILGFTHRSCDEKYIALVMDRIHNMKNKDSLRFVGVHEVGHLIGLAHIPVPNESIMFPSADKAATCPTKLDMKEFCMFYGCDWKQMKYCD
jgi:hypothetical protein